MPVKTQVTPKCYYCLLNVDLKTNDFRRYKEVVTIKALNRYAHKACEAMSKDVQSA